jgi:Protein of unknown function (DUF3172)
MVRHQQIHSLLPVMIFILLLGISLQLIPFTTCFCISSLYRQQHQKSLSFSFKVNARNIRQSGQYDDEDDDYYYEDDDNDEDDDDDIPRRRRQQQQQRRQRSGVGGSIIDNLGGGNRNSNNYNYYGNQQSNNDGGLDLPSPFGRRSGWRLPDSVSKSLLAGVFVLGVGLGVTIDSQVNTNPKDLASRDAIDQAAPNAELCAQLGASAMAFDQRVFVSFNPFNVYVSQADVKPACVLREANVVSALKTRGLINDNEVRSCKMNMNTWAFVGDLNDTPQLSCVYKSQDAQNEFLSNPKFGIGEDYLDDDRERIIDTRKIVKGSLTEAQKQNLSR